jgi:hypothetical protein
MKAHKNGIAISIPGFRPAGQRNENVPASSHDHFQPSLFQELLNATSCIQSQVFFKDVTDASTSVVPAVAWVQNHSVKGADGTLEEEKSQHENTQNDAPC